MSDDPTANDVEEGQGEEGASGTPRKSTYVAAGSVAANTVMVGASFVVVGMPIAIFSGVAAATAVPQGGYVVKQNKTLEKEGSVRETNNLIIEQTNRLKKENAKLKQSVTMLKESVNRLKKVEEGLSAMADAQGTDMERLTQLVKENQETIDEMKRLMKGKISQTIISTILKCDDGDGKLDDGEIEILNLRLSNIEGVTYHQDAMVKLIKKNEGSVYSVMRVVRDMLADKPTEVKIFSFDNDNEYD